MFSLEPAFNFQQFDRELEENFNGLVAEIAQALFETGVKLVDLARMKTKSDGGFGNVTFDLRASIGCVLVLNSQISEDHIYFPQIAESSDGHTTGLNFAREVAFLVDEGEPVLVFSAGQEYAFILESKGIDVITGSSLHFESEFKRLINQL
ncbi:MAG: hypothetical protein EOO20_06240 [Chryseobacterium sp.]|nr:MAG: hypothetical protein EOO20_06240 [Chryseobacterium sp.]